MSDAIIPADAIATSLPGFNIAYKLAKAYTGRGMELRKQRALEWVEFVHDNLGAFSQELFEQEEFQDCFVLLFNHLRVFHNSSLIDCIKSSSCSIPFNRPDNTPNLPVIPSLMSRQLVPSSAFVISFRS